MKQNEKIQIIMRKEDSDMEPTGKIQIMNRPLAGVIGLCVGLSIGALSKVFESHNTVSVSISETSKNAFADGLDKKKFQRDQGGYMDAAIAKAYEEFRTQRTQQEGNHYSPQP